MKKTALRLLILFLCLALCGCGQNRQVLQAQELIAGIGTVTLDSEQAIAAAEEAVAALSEREQNKLENLDALRQAREELDALVRREVETVETAIAAIGEVSLDSRGDIDGAWSAYHALAEDLREQVSNFDLLVQAEEDYLRAQVADIEAAIAAIGSITLDSGPAIARARQVYDSYDPQVQALVTNLETLTTAEAVHSGLRAGYAMSLIAAIGEVTLDSDGAIAAARAWLGQLTGAEAAQVVNADVLTAAEDAYARLRARATLRVTGLWCSEQDTAGGVELYFNFVNPSERVIAEVTFGVTFYNGAGEMVMCQYDQAEVNLNTYEGPFGCGDGLSGTGWFWGDYYNWDIESVALSYLSVVYTDGTVVTLTQDELEYVWY